MVNLNNLNAKKEEGRFCISSDALDTQRVRDSNRKVVPVETNIKKKTFLKWKIKNRY